MVPAAILWQFLWESVSKPLTSSAKAAVTAEFTKNDRLLCVSPPPGQRYGANYRDIKNQPSHTWQTAAARLSSET